MKARVSVIIPIYNVQQFLERCLNSIVKQTLKNIEIICVNDGSTDDSKKILDAFSLVDERIVVLNQDNKGLSAARNKGIDAATGEYIGFVDSDDWVDLDFFEKLYNAAVKHHADIACCSIIRKYPSLRTRDKVKICEEKLYHITNEKFKITITPRHSYVWNKIYKRSELEKHKLRFKEGVYFEDVYFTIRALFYMGPLVTVPDVSYYYWVNKQSITRDMNDKKQIDHIAARADFIKFSRENYIICDNAWYVKNKKVYKFLGIPIIKIVEWETIKEYYLFSLIKVLEKRIYL